MGFGARVPVPDLLPWCWGCLADGGRTPAVCNAGVGLMGPLETCSEQAMRTVFEVNLFGAIRTIQAFLPAMKRRRAGRIVVTGSVGGLQGGRCMGEVGCAGLGGGVPGSQSTALPQGCPSIPCTAPANSPWRGCARAWPSSCGPSTSSECRRRHGEGARSFGLEGLEGLGADGSPSVGLLLPAA